MQLQLVWVDVVLHKIFPIVVVLDWILDPPRTRLSFGDGLLWLAFPLAWTGFTLVAAPSMAGIPYPFLDPANGGYGTVAVTVVAVTIGFALIARGTIAIGNRARAGGAVAGRRSRLTGRDAMAARLLDPGVGGIDDAWRVAR